MQQRIRAWKAYLVIRRDAAESRNTEQALGRSPKLGSRCSLICVTWTWISFAIAACLDLRCNDGRTNAYNARAYPGVQTIRSGRESQHI